MPMGFREFRDGLTSDQKEKLDQVFEEEVRKKQRNIMDEIRKDRHHIELVNFCANLFVPGLELHKNTGYQLLLVEPLFTLGVKNFDIAVFRNENRSLLLIECKHSVSDVRDLIKDLSTNISETEKHREELEELVGSHVDIIEYVLCAPAINVNELLNETAKQNVPVCVWGCNMFTKEIRLFSKTSTIEDEIGLGRVHRDKNLNKILFRGVVSQISATRSVPILLSSHMCSLLIHVILSLYLERIRQAGENTFSFSDVYNILFKEYQNYTQISEEELTRIALAVVGTARRKEICQDLTPDIPELIHKTYRVAGRQTSARVIGGNAHDRYVLRNAQKLAERTAIERFRKETGFMGLDEFLR